MGKGYGRRRRSMAASIVGDAVYIANRLSWKAATVFGVVSFIALYWLVPALLGSLQSDSKSTVLRPALDGFVARRAQWFQWIAFAVLVVCLFFAVRNYFIARRLDREGERDVGWLGRVVARFLD
jgi:hypothetical protein